MSGEMEKKKTKKRKVLLCSSREPRSKLYLYLHQYLKKKKNQELSLLEQYTQPQTEKKQELKAFQQETLRLFIEWGCQTLQGLPSSLTESLLWII